MYYKTNTDMKKKVFWINSKANFYYLHKIVWTYICLKINDKHEIWGWNIKIWQFGDLQLQYDLQNHLKQRICLIRFTKAVFFFSNA